MDFAKNILSKYGWTEGQGIGKNLDGIVKPIKANLKFDKDGLGHDKAKDFTNHWWENAYNDAANNIDIEHKISSGNDAVAISLRNGESIDISTNGISMQKMQKDGVSGYGTTFRKMRSTLNNQIDDSSDDEVHSNGVSNVKKAIALTDEELLRACGGRTAHKGARHGLSLSGKLNRIEEQERQLLEKYSNNFDSNAAQEVFKDWVEVDTGKKKNLKKKTTTANEITVTSPDSEKLATLLDQNDYVVKYKSRKKKRRHKAIDEDLATALSKCLNTTQSSDTTTQSMNSDEKLHGILESSSVIKKKKSTKKVEKMKTNKKKRKPKVDEGFIIDEDIEITEVDGFTLEQQKYLKHPPGVLENAGVDEIDTVAKVKQTKKCKRKHKEAKAVKNDDSSGNDNILKVSKREKSKIIKNNRTIEKIAKKLETIMSLDETDTVVEKSKTKKKKKKKTNESSKID